MVRNQFWIDQDILCLNVKLKEVIGCYYQAHCIVMSTRDITHEQCQRKHLLKSYVPWLITVGDCLTQRPVRTDIYIYIYA